jgi:LCP family protein required for cell wall assembly
LGLFVRRFAVACLLVAVVATAGVVVGNVVGRAKFHETETVHISELDEQEQGKPANYLLIGSDSRDPADLPNQGGQFGTEEETGPQHSDTMMILHVEPDQKSGLLVSFPRDLLVDVPGHGREQLNAAYSLGSAPLLIETIQQNFDIPIHHYLEVSFLGFERIVDAIGGVNVYFPTPVHDPYSQLHIDEAGCRSLDGPEALAYARSRHYYVPTNLDDPAPWEWSDERERAGPGWTATGSDIDRIPRQQYFLRTLSQAAIEKTGNNPLKAFGLLDAVVSNLKRDDELTEGQLKALVRTFRGLDPRTVQMTTIPYEQAPSDPNRVVVKTPDADPIIQRLQNFSIPKGFPKLLPPETIKVRVVNGSGLRGRARAALDAFVAHGFVKAGDAVDADRSDYPKTQVRYAPDKSEAGATVAITLGTTNLVEAASAEDTLGGDVLVVIGRDYDGLNGVLKQSPSSTTAGQTPSSQTPASGRADAPASTTSTTMQSTTVDTRFVPVDPETGGPLVGCP